MKIAASVISATILLLLYTVPSAACEHPARAVEALKRKDGDGAEAAYRASLSDPACKSDDHAIVQRIAAQAIRAQAYAMLPDDGPLIPIKPALTRALEIGSFTSAPWEVHADLGEIARVSGDRIAAAEHYQMALLDLQMLGDPANVLFEQIQSPRYEQFLQHVSRRAEETRLAAPRYVNARGRAACPIKRERRRIKTAVPVRFPTNVPDRAAVQGSTTQFSEVFTADGMKAATELYQCLANLPRGDVISIRIIGHTDERADDVYNLALSQRRAQVVHDFLVSKGLTLDMTVEGRGERELYRPDADVYTQQERWQMSRRVEVDVTLNRN